MAFVGSYSLIEWFIHISFDSSPIQEAVRPNKPQPTRSNQQRTVDDKRLEVLASGRPGLRSRTYRSLLRLG